MTFGCLGYLLVRQSRCQKLFELKKNIKNIIYGKDTTSKPLKRLAEQLNKEDNMYSVKVFKGNYDKSEFIQLWENILPKEVIEKNCRI